MNSVKSTTTPRLEINTTKITHNAIELKKLYGSKGIEIIAVTKGVCGDPVIVDALLKSGITMLADSRISNIRRMRNAGIEAQYMLLRTPLLSQIDDVISYTDISLNSELSVIKALSKTALKQKKIHKIVLMVELGDLREGILPADLDDIVQVVIKLDGIDLVGIGVNLACLSGIKPGKQKMDYLSSLAIDLETKFGLKLEFVSGGNSANYTWFKSTENIGRINSFRLGESIYLGCETLYREPIPGLFTDAFRLVTEVIESKIKPSMPDGEIGQDAFGHVPSFQDKGDRLRSILAIGRQDVSIADLTPLDDIEIIASGSDHLVVDASNVNLKVGDNVAFQLNYGALISAMVSPYIAKVFLS